MDSKREVLSSSMLKSLAILSICTLLCQASTQTVSIGLPSSIPASAVSYSSELLSVSIEFFAFPGYTTLSGTSNCLANIEALRLSPPSVRIGGTTQDRATYDPNLNTAVNYTVPTPADAPDFLSYGPDFFSLANTVKGDVTIGLNRQLNNITNTNEAAVKATELMHNLLAIELGNEPEFYNSSSPIIPKGQNWSPTTDGASQKLWIDTLSPTMGAVLQAAVYLQYPTWSTAGLIPRLGNAITGVKTFSGHSYPQSACGGASTNLTSLMSHAGIVTYTKQYASEAAAAHAQNKSYFLGETNSATCGGGGISPTFGAGLWVMDYVLQAALNGVDRLYFHQGTISNCAYCFWGDMSVFAPYYGAAFVSDFLGSDNKYSRLVALDDGISPLAVYALYSTEKSSATRLLIYNSAFYNGTASRPEMTVSLSNLSRHSDSVHVKRLVAPSADALTGITIGGSYGFDAECRPLGTQVLETISVSNGSTNVSVGDSEALIMYL